VPGTLPPHQKSPSPHPDPNAGHCCVDEERVRLIGVVPRSDSEGEFGEGRRKPTLRVELHAEFIVAAVRGSRSRPASLTCVITSGRHTTA
jgi:hypothetical protein